MSKGVFLGAFILLQSCVWVGFGWEPARDFMYLTVLVYILAELDRIASALQAEKGDAS